MTGALICSLIRWGLCTATGTGDYISALYIPFLVGDEYIRPQGVENRASRPLSRT